MRIEQISLDEMRYNPETGAFETLVKIHDGEEAFSYPAQVAAPLNAEYGLIAHNLAEAGRRAHKGASGEIRLHHAPAVTAAVVTGSQKGFFSRLMGRGMA